MRAKISDALIAVDNRDSFLLPEYINLKHGSFLLHHGSFVKCDMASELSFSSVQRLLLSVMEHDLA